MANIPTTITQSILWRSTLAELDDDRYSSERERLRSSFSSFRERASHLANEIRKDIPDLTIHDITHLDALWEVASLIVGNQYLLTPTEGYVLGGAILLHDLAMSIAATPGGMQSLQDDPRWSDLVYNWYQENENRSPTDEEINTPTNIARQYVLFNLLRQKHAENAEKLAFINYKSGSGSDLFLVEDTELRQTFGQLIGKIAHSHWWSIERIEREFSRVAGAPHWAPTEWTVDPMKISCILRAADAAHIDARRAPSFIRAISSISKGSELHWAFQEKLNKPYIRDDSLVFTSGQAFSLQEANAWWYCLETLRMVDRELRGIDALLADKLLPRFAAKHVASVDSPERLATYIQTTDWFPINATVHISDLPHIVKSIGGEELYGKRPKVPVRELIQNASDAVRARRIYEKRDITFGEIRVSLFQEADTYCLRIEDDGIGMSQRVLTDFLLDFGRSFWSSPEMQEEFPGLLSSGFRATGKYGIGFFSVFMVADKVTVITRRTDAAKKDTLVLEFGTGLSGRPILRPAETCDQLRDGGTVIIVRLNSNPYEKGGLLYSDEDSVSLAELCAGIAPALDVRLIAIENGERLNVLEANDWIEIDGFNLLERLGANRFDESYSKEDLHDIRTRAAKNLRVIKNEEGEIIGRACISIGYSGFSSQLDTSGQLVVGGLVASPLSGIAGILLATPQRATRDSADPLISHESLARWSEEQADLVSQLWTSPELQMFCAQNIRICGGKTKSLPIAKYGDKFVSAIDIEKMVLPDSIIILSNFTIKYELKLVPNLILDSNVFVTNSHSLPVIFQNQHGMMFERNNYSKTHGRLTPDTLSGAVIEAVSVAWNIEISDLVKEINFKNDEVEVKIGNGVNGEVKVKALLIKKPSITS